MKHFTTNFGLLLSILLASSSCSQHRDFSQLNGPYLGQKPPGMHPEVFAPGIISTDSQDEGFYNYMAGGRIFIFDRGSGSSYTAYITELIGGKWTKPHKTQLFGNPLNENLSLEPDENTFYFASRRSPDGSGQIQDHNLFIVKQFPEGWSNPRMFDSPVNSDQNDLYPSVTQDGTLYFFSNRDDDFENEDIYRSRFINGKYSEVERLGPPINTEHDEIDPFIASDESYLIYCSKTLAGYGGYDLYISFRNTEDSWTDPLNMGDEINSSGFDWIPYVPPDGKYFFFCSDRNGNSDIYWIDAAIINKLKNQIRK